MLTIYAGRFLLLALIPCGLFAERPSVIAHRGGAALRPENTIAAFQHALDLKVPILEFDMNMTADGQIVIHHDSSVNASICKPDPKSEVQPGPIGLLRLAELLQFDCGSFIRPKSPLFQSVPGQRMATLDDFLTLVKDQPVMLLGETKMPDPDVSYAPDPVKFVAAIDAAIRKYGLEKRFTLQSFDYRTIDAMYQQNPGIARCLLGARRFRPKYLEIARKHHATHLMLRYDDISPEDLRELKIQGLKIFSGTSNLPSEWEKYVDLKIDGILTDDPQSLKEFLSRKKIQ